MKLAFVLVFLHISVTYSASQNYEEIAKSIKDLEKNFSASKLTEVPSDFQKQYSYKLQAKYGQELEADYQNTLKLHEGLKAKSEDFKKLILVLYNNRLLSNAEATDLTEKLEAEYIKINNNHALINTQYIDQRVKLMRKLGASELAGILKNLQLPDSCKLESVNVNGKDLTIVLSQKMSDGSERRLSSRLNFENDNNAEAVFNPKSWYPQIDTYFQFIPEDKDAEGSRLKIQQDSSGNVILLSLQTMNRLENMLQIPGTDIGFFKFSKDPFINCFQDPHELLSEGIQVNNDDRNSSEKIQEKSLPSKTNSKASRQ